MNNSAYPPLFLLASERSGTNLLRKRITEHQETYVGPSPVHLLKNLGPRQFIYQDLSIDNHFIALIEDAISLCTIHFSPWDISLNSQKILEEFDKKYPHRHLYNLLDYFFSFFAFQKKYTQYLCKDNGNMAHIIPLMHYFPSARFIYLYRDPRDVILSQIKRTGAGNNILHLAKMWKDEQLAVLNAIPYLSKDQYLFVSYESLIQEEDVTLNRILAFLEVAQVSQSFSDTGTSEEWRNLNKPTMCNNAQKYKKELSQSQIKQIESICWDVMQLLNYKTEEVTKPHISTARKVYTLTTSELMQLFKSKRSVHETTSIHDIRAKRAKLLRSLRV